MRRCRGFTLVEGLIVCTLLLGMMGLVAAFFDRGQRYTVQTNSYATVQREANEILRRVADDLYRATLAQNQTFAGGGVFLSFSPVDPEGVRLEMDTEGRILWKKWIGYYLDTDQRILYRTEVPLETATSDLSVSPAPAVDASYLRTEPGLVRRPFGRGVTSFNLTPGGRRLGIELTTRGAAGLSGLNEEQRKIEVTVSTEISVLD